MKQHKPEETTLSSNINKDVLENRQAFVDIIQSTPATFKSPLLKSDAFIQQMSNLQLHEHADAFRQITQIAEEIKRRGGRALLVGGCVRDAFAGKTSKDYDIEVFGLEPTIIEEIVTQYGNANEVGKTFGILKIYLDNGLDIDVSLPRIDSKVSAGHNGFKIKSDPYMSIKEAGLRRDFTINSMSADPLTGEVFDYYGGVADIENKILRITDEEKFKEDSLRVLRGIQFIGRFKLQIEENTFKILQNMIPFLKELSKERVFEEWQKLLLKSEKPSLGLSAGLELGITEELYPELYRLRGVEQSPKWHQEGDVWNHTMLVVDKMSQIISEKNIDNDKALTLMLASVVHDLGKPDTTKLLDGDIVSYGHEKAGIEPAKNFLNQIGLNENKRKKTTKRAITRAKILKLVENHLAPALLYDSVSRGEKVSNGAIRRLATRIHPATIEELVLLYQADHQGRQHTQEITKTFDAGNWLLDKAKQIDLTDKKPANLLKGKDLIQLGLKPNKDFGEIIRLTNELRDKKEYTKKMILDILEQTKTTQAAITSLQTKCNL